MTEHPHPGTHIPVLTDVVAEEEADRADDDAAPPDAPRAPSDMESLIAELQTQLAASTFALTERLLHAALAEVEATISEQVTAKLRQQLPELIDGILRRHLGADEDE